MKIQHAKWLGLAICLALLLPASVEAQKRRPRGKARPSAQKPAPEPPPTPVASPLDTVLDIGGDFLNSAARLLSGDPYAAFRGATYSNDNLMNEADEARLALFVDRELRRRFRVVPTGQERLNRIGPGIAQASPRPGLKYRFFVINDTEINALSIPGGYIYVTTGLMNLANDDELASVLAHEVGHIAARHGLKSVKHAQSIGELAALVGAVTGVAGADAKQFGAFAANMVGQGILATHGREDEREADYLGLLAMTKAGHKPEAMITMFQKLQKMRNSQPDLLGAIFNDHPDVNERIANTAYEIKKIRGE